MTSRSQIDAGGARFRLTLKDDLTADIRQSLSGVVSVVIDTRNAIDREMKAIGRQIAKTGKMIAGLGAGAAAFGSASSFGFLRAAAAAGDFAETVNMFDAVFKDQSASVRAWGKEYGNQVRRSESQMLSFLAQSQDTFVPLGFDRKEAAELSKTVTKLAIDLGSFKNIDDDDALRRLLGGLVGNTENLKAFGVQAGQAQVKAKALSLGFDPRNLTAYQKALTILEITLDGTKDAQGDAINTADEYVNSVKGLRAEIARFTVAVGEPVKAAVTKVVQALRSALSSVNSLLERFPILTKLAAVGAVAIAGIGFAAVTAGGAIALLGGSLSTVGILALGSLVRANGVMGTFALASRFAGTAVTRVSVALGAQAVAFRAASVSSLTFGGALRSVGAAIARMAGSLALLIRPIAFRAMFASIIVGFKAMLAAILTGLTVLFRFIAAGVAKLAIALVNPWSLLAIAIVAAMKLAERYYNKQREFEEARGEKLDQQRDKILTASFQSSGIAVPSEFKSLDVNNAKVVGPGVSVLSEADRDLADEIQSIRSSLQKFRERIQGAERLRDRGTITEADFAKFAKQELDRFRKTDPTIQARDSLRQQLLRPIEVFRASINKAQSLFSKEPLMFQRAKEAAIEQFKASDKAAQMALQLQSPLEKYNDAIAEATKLFANDPKNLSRALDAAADQFRSSDPAEQLRIDLRRPIDIFRERMAEIRKIVSNAAPSAQRGLLARASEQAKEQFEQSDPATAKAKQIQDDLKSDGAKIAQELQAASELVKRGLLTKGQFTSFRKNLFQDALGDRPEVEVSKAISSTSAALASQFGAFAPTFDKDEQLREFEERKINLHKQTVAELKKISNKKPVFR